MITMSKLTLTQYYNLQTFFSFCQLSHYVLSLVQDPIQDHLFFSVVMSSSSPLI